MQTFSLPATRMTKPSIKRVGIVVKPHQPDAVKTVCKVVEWLGNRGISVAGGTEMNANASSGTGCAVEALDHEQLAASVDLMLVLGGDGTMIATARMLGDKEVPVLGVNYGGLGYLAEFRVEELYTALESILEGNYRLDTRVMLAVQLMRDNEEVARTRVLNDAVINKSALARIIEIELSKPTIRQFIPGRWPDRFHPDGFNCL